MTAAETGLLLLCCALPEAEDRPLTMAQFQELAKRARVLGPGGENPLRELTERDLERLGYSQEQCGRIVRLLSRETQLERYLRAAERNGIVPITRLSPRYPARLRQTLGQRCPAVLFSTKMDIDELNAECADFVGTHDFSAFCAAGASVEDKVRTVESVGFERNGDLVTFRVRGDGFLYNMVRIMVGTCLDIATGKIGKGKIKEIIDSKNRENAGHTAPARGLFLNDVIY